MFHERLSTLRKRKGLSQKECASELGIEASKYNKWENGKNNPDFETVCRLAKYFDTTTDYLLGATDHDLKPITLHENPKLQSLGMRFIKEASTLYNDMELKPDINSDEFEDIFSDHILMSSKLAIKRCRVCYSLKERFTEDDGSIDPTVIGVFLISR